MASPVTLQERFAGVLLALFVAVPTLLLLLALRRWSGTAAAWENVWVFAVPAGLALLVGFAAPRRLVDAIAWVWSVLAKVWIRD